MFMFNDNWVIISASQSRHVRFVVAYQAFPTINQIVCGVGICFLQSLCFLSVACYAISSPLNMNRCCRAHEGLAWNHFIYIRSGHITWPFSLTPYQPKYHSTTAPQHHSNITPQHYNTCTITPRRYTITHLVHFPAHTKTLHPYAL